MGVPIIRIIVFWGLYYSALSLRSEQSLLKAICNLDGGVECLLRLLGHVFDDPACDADVLYRGLAVLVPKVSCVLEPKQTRPLVLTETITKLAARVAMHRVLESWPVVDECMGGRRGLQVSHAVFTAKTMLAKSKVFDCDAVFVKLDLSSAYDSLSHAAVVDEVLRWYVPSTSKSCRFLLHMITASSVAFHCLGVSWNIAIRRGTVQGGTHSPGLFSALVGIAFRRIADSWEQRGFRPPFATARGLWGIWWVDDSFLCFSSVDQASLLLPELVRALGELGLSINFDKCQVMGNRLPVVLPGILASFRRVAQVVFLGVPMSVSDSDVSAAEALTNRAVRAFMTSRVLLTCSQAPVQAKASLFQSLVESTFKWVAGCLRLDASVLRMFRVQGVTLCVWMLGLRWHESWYDDRMLAVVRHVCKCGA